jgi:hypothetical protein
MNWWVVALCCVCVLIACPSDQDTEQQLVPADAPVLQATPPKPAAALKKVTPTKDSVPAASPREASPKPVEPAPVKSRSHKQCVELCIMVMDQAGQVTDECSKECQANDQAYSKSDLVSDDENAGLVVRQGCMTECLSPADPPATAECRQSCCDQSCRLRAEYNGGGYGSDCPSMCRDFLKRTKKR